MDESQKPVGQYLVKILRERFDVMLLAVFSFGLYINTLPGKFIWDDTHLVGGFPTWKAALTREFLSKAFYRPFSALSIYLDTKRADGLPAAYHWTNIILHVAVVILLYFLMQKLTSRKWVAFFAAAAFAALPVHVEAVAWISGRTDLLCTAFFLAALLSHIKYRETGSGNWLTAACGLMLIALFSKEAAGLFIVAVLAYEWLFGHLRKYPAGPWLRVYAGGLLLYAAVRLAVVKSWGDVSIVNAEKLFEPSPLLERVWGLPVNVARYIWMTIVPHEPEPFLSASVFTNPFHSAVIISVAIILVLLGLIFFMRTRRPAMSFGILLFGLTIVPASNIIQLPGTTMAERYAYLPSVGLVLAAASLITLLHERVKSPSRTWVGAILVCAALCYTGYAASLTVQGNLIWRDEFSFWSAMVAKSPKTAFAYNGLGRAYEEKGLPDMAEQEYKTAIRLDSHYATPHSNLAEIYRNNGDLAGAERELRIAVKLEPTFYVAWNSLGGVLGMQNKFVEAEEALKKALELYPEFNSAHANLALLYQNAGRYKEAAVQYEEILKTQPELASLWLELGKCLRKAGEAEKARIVLQKVADQAPDSQLRTAAENELSLLPEKR